MTELARAVDRMEPIDLAELLERAALQDRVDRKYLLPLDHTVAFVDQLRPLGRVLHIDELRSFDYESVYFDTPDLTCYLLAARRRRRRFKIRTRTYVDSEACFLEVKTRDHRGHTVKVRQLHDVERPAVLTTDGRRFTDQAIAGAAIPYSTTSAFAPTLVTSYRRNTLFLKASGSRVTIDTDLRWSLGNGRCVALPELAIIETKTAGRPSQADRLLWRNGSRPRRISKYGTGLAALRPDLPSTKWRRILRQHFPPSSSPPRTQTHLPATPLEESTVWRTPCDA